MALFSRHRLLSLPISPAPESHGGLLFHSRSSWVHQELVGGSRLRASQTRPELAYKMEAPPFAPCRRDGMPPIVKSLPIAAFGLSFPSVCGFLGLFPFKSASLTSHPPSFAPWPILRFVFVCGLMTFVFTFL